MKRKCDICDSKVVTKQPSDKLVQPGNVPFKKNLNIGQKLKKNVIDLKLGEPVLVNPNTLLSLKFARVNNSLMLNFARLNFAQQKLTYSRSFKFAHWKK